jgi:hypothetical protein
MLPLSILAECQSCGHVFFHVRGQSGHVCEVCGGHIACGYPDCDKPADALPIASDDTVPLNTSVPVLAPQTWLSRFGR